jgi:hypothetical protein
MCRKQNSFHQANNCSELGKNFEDAAKIPSRRAILPWKSFHQATFKMGCLEILAL